MTSRRTRGLVGLLLAGTCASAIPALAQQRPPAYGADHRGPSHTDRRGPPSVDGRVQRMTTDLGLSVEQATKVRTLLTAERRQADSVLAQRARQQDAGREAMMAVHSGTEKSLAAIFTPEQRTRHDAMRARGGPEGRGGRDGRGLGRGDDERRRSDRDGRRDRR